MFKKKITIYNNIKKSLSYRYDLNELKNYFCFIPKNLPIYFKTIPKQLFSPIFKTFMMKYRTIKTCPGFINLFKRSILVLSPYDIQIIFDEKNITYSSLQDTAIVHPNDQLITYIPSKKYKFLIKMELHVFIKTNVALLMHSSWYHFNDLDIPSGILPKNYDENLSFFIPIKKEQKELIIRQGDPLFLLTPLTESKIKLNFKNKYLIRNFKNTFSLLKKFAVDSLS